MLLKLDTGILKWAYYFLNITICFHVTTVYMDHLHKGLKNENKHNVMISYGEQDGGCQQVCVGKILGVFLIEGFYAL